MEAVIIEAHRTGYSISQIRNTITVGELIEVLSDYPKDSPVYLSHDEGYTYGPIYDHDIDLRIENEEED